MLEERVRNEQADPLAEAYPPLTEQQALVEANRCLYCYDAPCTHACPTHIDIPRFIKKIATGNLLGSARTILDSNLLGSTCSRVCPVQELCEGACVLGSDHKPIAIGRLQRHAMDSFSGTLSRSVATGKSVAVVGAGPAGLSCAGELARLGHQVTLFEKRDLPGGLSTYGIIAIREPVGVSLAEVEMIKGLGVVAETGREFCRDIHLEELQAKFDAVFLGIGLGNTPSLGIPGEAAILDGLDYIEASKIDRAGMKIGRHVVVIGAGNTAIDCATIAKRLGAERVTIVYRRSEAEMTAYPHEYEFIKSEGVEFEFLTQPIQVVTGSADTLVGAASQSPRALSHSGDQTASGDSKSAPTRVSALPVIGLQCIRMALGPPDSSGRASSQPIPGSEFVIETDQVVKAIGQERPSIADKLGLETTRGLLKVNDSLETSIQGVFAGGDCIRSTGAASTVMAVQDGKLAAKAIHQRIMGRAASQT